MTPNPDPTTAEATARRLAFADELMHLVGRYHDDDGVDRRYLKAARMIREIPDPEQFYHSIERLANRDPNTGMRWIPLSAVATVLGLRDLDDADPAPMRGRWTDPLPLRLDEIAKRIAAVPAQVEDAAAIRRAAMQLRAVEHVATRLVLVCPDCGAIKGEDPNCGWMGTYERVRVPVQPTPPVSDEAAIERAAAYLRTVEFSALPEFGGDRRAIAEAVLRAALESPK